MSNVMAIIQSQSYQSALEREMQFKVHSPIKPFENTPLMNINKASVFAHSQFHPSTSLKLIRISSPINKPNNTKEDSKIPANMTLNAPLSPTIKPRQIRIEQPDCSVQSRSTLKPPKQINHNLSAVNLTNPENGLKNPRSKALQNIRHVTLVQDKKCTQWQGLARFLQNRRSAKENCREYKKNFKETPSFIRKKNDVSKGVLQEGGIKVLKNLGEHRRLVLHKKSQSLLAMKCYSKKQLYLSGQMLGRFKAYLKQGQINHNLLVKYFGYTSDKQNIYIFQEYLAGQTLDVCINSSQADFNQSVVGPLICSIMTVIKSFRGLNQPYAKIAAENIIYSMNVCKFKRQFLSEAQANEQPRDIVFDIWCIGKLAYELVTHSELVPKDVMKKVTTIEQIFGSKEITKCIEIGFKKFQEIPISAEFVEFLIATLWTVQTKDTSLEVISQLEFIKLYSEDDLWTHPREQSENNKVQ